MEEEEHLLIRAGRYISAAEIAGSPHPRLSWWRGHQLLDDSYEVINGETTNTLRVSGGLRREDLGEVFTCQAVNNNQSIPVSTSLNLDMTCEYAIKFYYPGGKKVMIGLGRRKKKFRVETDI